jgi:transposase
VKAHLREFRGKLQADGYAGYDAVYEDGRVKGVACVAHVRRPFYDLYEAHKSAVAKEALERIAALYRENPIPPMPFATRWDGGMR